MLRKRAQSVDAGKGKWHSIAKVVEFKSYDGIALRPKQKTDIDAFGTRTKRLSNRSRANGLLLRHKIDAWAAALAGSNGA